MDARGANMRMGRPVYVVVLLLVGACDADDPVDAPDADAQPTPVSFDVRIENVAPWTVLKSGVQSVKVGSTVAGPLGAGDAFEISFSAGRGQRFSFATMLGESNDWFFAPRPQGIALFDGVGTPRSGDVTGEVALWNAGTEVDEEPGVGEFVGPRQSAPDAGDPDPDATIRELGETIPLTDGSTFVRPSTAAMIRVNLEPQAGGRFTVRIQDVSTAETLVTSEGTSEIHLSPVVWALHVRPAP